MNRGTFPWGMEDETLHEWYRKLGRLREVRPSLRVGGLRWIRAEGHLLAFAREFPGAGLARQTGGGCAERQPVYCRGWED